MNRKLSTKTPNTVTAQPATVDTCKQDRQGRNDAKRASEACVQRAFITPRRAL
ncbi:hypothetical protein [Streptomyces sp. NPDC059063]|uniref:hypothetical protein n=1 Tax=Streptomyces sp. NPDC059063 TaxID=3346712 RepID=UPI00368C48D1